MFPVFSLVLDKDVKSEVAMLYPELYKDLLKVLKECSHAGFRHGNACDCEGLTQCFFFTGSTTVIQDVSNMGFDKYLSR